MAFDFAEEDLDLAVVFFFAGDFVAVLLPDFVVFFVAKDLTSFLSKLV